MPSPRGNKLAGVFQKTLLKKIEHDLVKREYFLEPTRWNKIKLFVANIYEIALITIGFGLSIA